MTRGAGCTYCSHVYVRPGLLTPSSDDYFFVHFSLSEGAQAQGPVNTPLFVIIFVLFCLLFCDLYLQTPIRHFVTFSEQKKTIAQYHTEPCKSDFFR